MSENYLTFNPAKPTQRSNYLLTTFVSNYDDLGRKSIENMIDNIDIKEGEPLYGVKKKRIIIDKIAHIFGLSNPIEWIFIIIFSVIATIILLILDRLIENASKNRKLLASTSYPLLNFFLWTGSSIIFFLIATSVGYFISPDADGSGIPEMKTALSGVTKTSYFSFNAFIGKSLGLFAALVGGASVGKVGPYVHLSCIICNILMKINIFNQIDKSISQKMNMISIACATGLTFALGSPLGGVLFSIESTASIYIVSNIWKAFFSSVICSIVIRIFRSNEEIVNIEKDEILQIGFGFSLMNFAIIGLLSGTIGAYASTLISKGVFIRKKTKVAVLNNRFYFAILAAIITSIINFNFEELKLQDRKIMNFCFSSLSTSIPVLIHPNEGLRLFISFILKYILTILCLVCTMPGGVFGPIFAAGALFGKIYGHIVNHFFKFNMENIFSMAGSAGMFSGFSHTFSSSLMIFEISGHSSYLSPLLLSSLLGNIIGQSISMGIFDVLLAIKNLPHLPAIKSKDVYSMNAGELMQKIDCLKQNDMKVIDGLEILVKIPKKTIFFIPVIDENSFLKYSINSIQLYYYLFNKYNDYKNKKYKKEINPKDQTNLNELFKYIHKRISGKNISFYSKIKNKFRKLYIFMTEKERIILNKNFQHESIMRIIEILKDKVKNGKSAFLTDNIDINDRTLDAEKSGLTIDTNYPCIKIQFLFTFLNSSSIFVTNNGKLCGYVNKDFFIKKTHN